MLEEEEEALDPNLELLSSASSDNEHEMETATLYLKQVTNYLHIPYLVHTILFVEK